MAKKWRQDPDVLAEIERLALEDFSSTSIERQLKDHRKFKGRVPSLRTIQAIAREAAPRDPSEWWSASAAPADEARVLLPILGELIDQSGGRRRRIRRQHAKWIARVQSWVPDIPAPYAYALGWAYERAERADEPSGALDRYLALRPWRDPAGEVAAFRDGRLDVLVWDADKRAAAGGALEILSERQDATLLWPFMVPHPIAMFGQARQTGSRRYEADVIDAENEEEEEDQP